MCGPRMDPGNPLFWHLMAVEEAFMHERGGMTLADIRADLKWLKLGTAIKTAMGIAVLLRVFLH